jgi:hypothetical protein
MGLGAEAAEELCGWKFFAGSKALAHQRSRESDRHRSSSTDAWLKEATTGSDRREKTMKRLLRSPTPVALAGCLIALGLSLAGSPAARFRSRLKLAAIEDFFTGTGEPDAQLAVFESLAYRARAAHGPPERDPRRLVDGWTWAEQDGLVLATFYNGCEVRWYVYAQEGSDLELVAHSAMILG